MSIQLLYAAAGSLAYGGDLHWLMAGTVFAGTATVKGFKLADCGVKIAVRETGGLLTVELYYAEPETVNRIGEELSTRVEGVVEKTTVFAEVAGLAIPVEMHYAGNCRGRVVEASGYLRLLLALPPASQPPVQPMASIPVVLEDTSLCGTVFCPKTGSSMEAVVVDIYVHIDRLKSWAATPLRQLVARDPTGRRLFVYAPVAES